MKPGDEPLLTVIIPSWNQRELLDRCLVSLSKQTVPARLVVIDNGSKDSTAAMLRKEYPEVTCVHFEHNRGFASAVNEGIRVSTTPFIALLNNDTEADPRWVETGLLYLQNHPEFSFFASRIVQFSRRDLLDSAGDCYSRTGMPHKRGNGELLHQYQESEPVLGASAGAAFYRRSLFEDIGVFDEDFYMYLEDVDFSLRAQLAGRKCLFLPEAVVYHHEAASDPGRTSPAKAPTEGANEPGVFYSRDRVYWITRNRWLLMIQYQPFRHLPWLLFGWCKSFLFHLLKAGFFIAFLRGLVSGVAGSPVAFRKRLELRRKRKLSNWEICQLIKDC
jgi:GT2 family glycosyltransferase